MAANGPAFTTITLRQRFLWGPGDQTLLPVLARMVRAGRFVWIDHGRARMSTTHVANVVHAATLALDRGRGGQAYFIADESTTTYREFLSALLATRSLTCLACPYHVLWHGLVNLSPRLNGLAS